MGKGLGLDERQRSSKRVGVISLLKALRLPRHTTVRRRQKKTGKSGILLTSDRFPCDCSLLKNPPRQLPTQHRQTTDVYSCAAPSTQRMRKKLIPGSAIESQIAAIVFSTDLGLRRGIRIVYV